MLALSCMSMLRTHVRHFLVCHSSWRASCCLGVHHRMASSSHPVAAVCQITATPDKQANFSACERLVDAAKKGGASMVFLPEAFDYIGSNLEETLMLSEELTGDTITRYTQLARKLAVWLSLGGFHERGPEWETDRRIYNTHVIIDDQGEIVSTYRKSHLFDVELPGRGVSLKESAFTKPGHLMPPVQTPIGKVGLGICYDLRFPELSLAMLRQGAEVLTYPSAFTLATGAAHWEVLLRARAIETQCFVLAAAQVGKHHEKRSSYGHALAVDPWGVVMADCGGGEDPGMALVEIDLEKLRETRRNMPVQKHRREAEFYFSLDAKKKDSP